MPPCYAPPIPTDHRSPSVNIAGDSKVIDAGVDACVVTYVGAPAISAAMPMNVAMAMPMMMSPVSTGAVYGSWAPSLMGSRRMTEYAGTGGQHLDLDLMRV